MATDDEAPEFEVSAFWVQGASDEQRDAHYRAQRWAHVLPWKIDRLHASRLGAVESHERVLQDKLYPDEARWPFMQIDAEAHFALVAARQLLRSLRAFDGNDRLPDGLTNAKVRDVRDAWSIGTPLVAATQQDAWPSREQTHRLTSGSWTAAASLGTSCPTQSFATGR